LGAQTGPQTLGAPLDVRPESALPKKAGPKTLRCEEAFLLGITPGILACMRRRLKFVELNMHQQRNVLYKPNILAAGNFLGRLFLAHPPPPPFLGMIFFKKPSLPSLLPVLLPASTPTAWKLRRIEISLVFVMTVVHILKFVVSYKIFWN